MVILGSDISNAIVEPLDNTALEVATMPQDDSFSTSSLITQLWGKDAPKMIRVLTCESSMKEWGVDGKVLISKTADKGIGQVNQIWWKKADELGFDLDTTLGNLMMSHYVWENSGFGAWTCSHLVP